MIAITHTILMLLIRSKLFFIVVALPPVPRPVASCKERVFDMTIGAAYLALIRNGSKTVEGRPNYPSFRGIHKGDIIRFSDDGFRTFIRVQVVQVELFKTVHGYLAQHLQHALPGTITVDLGLKVYERFFGVDFTLITKFSGVRAFTVSFLTDHKGLAKTPTVPVQSSPLVPCSSQDKSQLSGPGCNISTLFLFNVVLTLSVTTVHSGTHQRRVNSPPYFY